MQNEPESFRCLSSRKLLSPFVAELRAVVLLADAKSFTLCAGRSLEKAEADF
jgi:hypothetical protein